MPIIDYHCHLPPREIAEDRKFENLTKIWLDGDHYKWRAMRTNGVPEEFITGKAPDEEKFEKWAETVPFTMRNPLYHWTHMELKKPFGVDSLLNPATAKDIYKRCTGLLQQQEFSTRNLLRYFKVKILCTTDDPADDLRYHKQLQDDGFEIRVLPTFRADKAIFIDNPGDFNAYLDKLGEMAGIGISEYSDLQTALKKRHDFFHEMGCRLSDHGLE
jgi:glucuronate isomerase